eukprot:39030-Chlamydomonas_euryale.AAC.2
MDESQSRGPSEVTLGWHVCMMVNGEGGLPRIEGGIAAGCVDQVCAWVAKRVGRAQGNTRGRAPGGGQGREQHLGQGTRWRAGQR